MIDKVNASSEQYQEYWKGQKARSERRTHKAMSPIFDKSWRRVSGDMLDVLNTRRYLKEEDSSRRLRLVKKDPKIKQIDNVIISNGEKSLNALFANQEPHYNEEIPYVLKYLYPLLKKGEIKTPPMGDAEITKMRNKPFLGATFKQWISVNTQNALKAWRGAFRRVMTETGEVSRETLLIAELKKIFDRQERDNKNIMVNSQNEVSRKAQADLEGAIW